MKLFLVENTGQIAFRLGTLGQIEAGSFRTFEGTDADEFSRIAGMNFVAHALGNQLKMFQLQAAIEKLTEKVVADNSVINKISAGAAIKVAQAMKKSHPALLPALGEIAASSQLATFIQSLI